jgi:hypothetical protein
LDGEYYYITVKRLYILYHINLHRDRSRLRRFS